MSSKIIVLQAPGKKHLKYIKGRAIRLWESRGMVNGKLRECIKEILKDHRESLVSQIKEHSTPHRCDYCGSVMTKKEVKKYSPFCKDCWKKQVASNRIRPCEVCGVTMSKQDIDNYDNYCEWCWREHILKA